MGPLLSILKYTRPRPPLRISTPCSFCPKESSTSSSQTGFLIRRCLFACIFSLLQRAVKPHKDANSLHHTAPSVKQTVSTQWVFVEWMDVCDCSRLQSHHSEARTGQEKEHSNKKEQWIFLCFPNLKSNKERSVLCFPNLDSNKERSVSPKL